jgi:hypothetical protein
MTYELPPTRKRSPLLPWLYIFNSLSIKQFCQVHDKLDFPFCPPEAVRQFAHDFVLTYELMNRNAEHEHALEPLLRDGETTTFNLLEGISSDTRYEEKREGLFSNSFTILEQLGYADMIYIWGKQTQDFHESANIQSLRAMCRLLRQWAVIEWLNQRISPLHELFSVDRERVVLQYAPTYTRSTFPIAPLEPLELSEESLAALQVIILDHESKQLGFRNTMDEIRNSSRSTWEDFALRAGAADVWMRLEGYFRIDLREWKTILDNLSQPEKHILEQWALLHKDQERDLRLPLPDFYPFTATP